MAKKRYLVVHPKLTLKEPVKAGSEIDAEEADVQHLVNSGKLKLVVAKKEEAPAKKEPAKKKAASKKK